MPAELPAQDCQLCKRCETRSVVVEPWTKAKIVPVPYMVVVDQPFRSDEGTGEFASGNIGKIIGALTEMAGIGPKEYVVTGATRCYSAQKPLKAHIRACRQFVLADIEYYQPEAIIVMGNASLESILDLTKISAQRGSVFAGVDRIPVVPTYAPGILFGQPNNFEFMLNDFKKAVLARANGVTEPLGTEVTFCTTLELVAQASDTLQAADWFTFDIETTGLNPMAPNAAVLCFSFSCEPGRAFVVPLYGQYLTPVWESREDFDTVLAILKDIIESPVAKIAHNGKFDSRYMRRVHGFEVQEFTYDTQLLYAMIHEERPHNLEHLRTLFTDMTRYDSFKDDPGAKALLAEHGYAAYPSETLWQYAGADVDTTYRVAEALISRVEAEGAKGPRVFRAA